MRTHEIIATAWATANVALATLVPVAGPFPWGAVVAVAAIPLLVMHFAEPIAATMHRGFMERFASDRRKPQSPTVIRFAGWVILVVQTALLAARLA